MWTVKRGLGVVLGACWMCLIAGGVEGHREEIERDCEALSCSQFVSDRLSGVALESTDGAQLRGNIDTDPAYQPSSQDPKINEFQPRGAESSEPTGQDPKTPEDQPREAELSQLTGQDLKTPEDQPREAELSQLTGQDPKTPEDQPRGAESSQPTGQDPKTPEDQPRGAERDKDDANKGSATATLGGRSGRRKKSSSLLAMVMYLSLKTLSVATLLMVTFIKKLVLVGVLVVVFKAIYYKTEHVVGFEHLHQPQPEQWQDYGKHHESHEDSYRYYAQQVTSHAGLQPLTERFQTFL